MEEFSNSAQRLLTLIQQVASKPDKIPTSQTWAEVFGIDVAIAKSDPHDVNIKLHLVRKEIDAIEASMKSTDFPSDLYGPYLNSVRKVVSVTNIGAPWSSYKNNIQPQVILSLKYCAHILPKEQKIPTEELEAILDTINKLKEEIENSKLSPSVYEFLISQISIIENAIQDYPIAGGDSIRKAFKDGFSDLAERADEVNAADDKVEANKVINIWSAFKEAGSRFVETDRIATAYLKIIEKGQSATEAITGLLEL